MKRRSGGFRNARSTNSWFCCFGLVCLFVCQKYVTLVAGHMTGWTIDDIKKDTTWRRVTKEEKQRIDMRVAQAVTSTWRMVDSGSEEFSEESPMSLDRPPKAVAAAPPVRRAQGAGRIRQATCASCIACCAPFLVLYSHLHPDTHTHIQALASRFDKTMHAAGFQRASTLERSQRASTLERSPTQAADDEVDRLHRQLAAAKARVAALKKKAVAEKAKAKAEMEIAMARSIMEAAAAAAKRKAVAEKKKTAAAEMKAAAEKESFSDWKTVPLRMPSPPHAFPSACLRSSTSLPLRMPSLPHALPSACPPFRMPSLPHAFPSACLPLRLP